jgi:D-alanine transaminase
MTRTAYVNGVYAPLRAAAVSIQDRGYQFGDAVYEVWAIRGGRLFDREAHFARLSRSLRELRIAEPMSGPALMAVIAETVRRNRVSDGIVYLQVSRGIAPRDHAFPSTLVRPCIVVTAKSLDRAILNERLATGVNIISLPETRWARRDIKSINLLANVLARQEAKEAGAFEAWFVDDDGFVTEGTSSNAWIVDASGRIRTRGLSNDILHGVTRAALLRIAHERQMQVIESPFTIAEALAAREAFISSAGNPAVAVIAIDDTPVCDGRPGPVTRALGAAYLGGAP